MDEIESSHLLVMLVPVAIYLGIGFVIIYGTLRIRRAVRLLEEILQELKAKK